MSNQELNSLLGSGVNEHRAQATPHLMRADGKIDSLHDGQHSAPERVGVPAAFSGEKFAD